MEVHNCSINDIRLAHSAEVTVYDSYVKYISNIGESVLYLIGNLTGTQSCSLQNTAKAYREIVFSVRDQLGNPVESADVIVYDLHGDPVVSGTTESNGRCTVTLVFQLGGVSFTSAFSALVSWNTVNETVVFATTTLQPIQVALDLSEPLTPTESTGVETAEDEGHDDRNIVVYIAQSNQAVQIVVCTLCLIGAALHTSRRDRTPLSQFPYRVSRFSASFQNKKQWNVKI
jgi:hypothetical protein